MNRLVVAATDDGAQVAPRLAEIGLGVGQQLDVGLVAPLGVLAPDVLEIGREPFVQPGLGPFAAGEQVAPPLVRQLVRHQAVDVVVQSGPLVEQHQIGEGRGGRVLHSTENEIGDGDLTVSAVGVGHADARGKIVDHLWRSPEAAARVGFTPGAQNVKTSTPVSAARS